MPRITVNKDKCKGCLLCISVCPKGLIVIDKDLNSRGVKPVKFSRQTNSKAGGIPTKSNQVSGNPIGECIGCAMCALICPDCCIEVYK